MNREEPGKQAPPAQLAAQAAGARQIADAASATWRGVDAALSPVIGQRGVAALYRRSLVLTGREHPCLSDVRAGTDDALAPAVSAVFASLHTVLSLQAGETAADAQDALLQTFCDLLGSLIGAPLTERLLQPIRDNLSSGPAVQDSHP